MTNKKKYEAFCKLTYVPVFSQPWWLDAVCEEGYWDVLLYERDEQIIGALPYYVKKRMGISYITQPKLTQHNGVVIKYPSSQKYEKKLSYEKEVMTNLIEKLEKLPISYYQQNFHPKYTNWLPFYWKGYNQSTNYTYRIENIKDIDRVLLDFNHSKRKNIKKSSQLVDVIFDLSSKDFYENHKMTLAKQNDTIGYSYDLFKKIYDAAYKNNQGKIIYCKDAGGNIHAALFVIWDNNSAYNLISTIDPDFRNSGAASLVVYEIIKYVRYFVDVFDFEGSMIESVEDSFRRFGTVQTPYFAINKVLTKNVLIKKLINQKL